MPNAMSLATAYANEPKRKRIGDVCYVRDILEVVLGIFHVLDWLGLSLRW